MVGYILRLGSRGCEFQLLDVTGITGQFDPIQSNMPVFGKLDCAALDSLIKEILVAEWVR